MGLPLALVSGNVSKVFFESASREYDSTGQFYNSLKKSFLFLFAISIPMVIVLMLFAPPVCEFVFGEGWNIAGKYVVILAPMFGFRLIVSAISPALIIAKKQNVEFILQLFFVLSSLICFVITQYVNLPIETYLI